MQADEIRSARGLLNAYGLTSTRDTGNPKFAHMGHKRGAGAEHKSNMSSFPQSITSVGYQSILPSSNIVLWRVLDELCIVLV